MDILSAASHEQVVDMLHAIEDKLYETGVLVSATGDSEADATIAFREVRIQGKVVVALVVDVATGLPVRPTRSHWTPFRNYVLEKYATLQQALPTAIREGLLDCPGPLLRVNGRRLR